jgi:uncharacterized protein YjiS (DUF1127 family)
MHAPTLTFTTATQRVAQSIAEGLSSVIQIFARARRSARLRRELQGLSDHMLRDIGVSRPEINSIVAEVVGAAPATRRAVMASHRSREWPTPQARLPSSF